MSILLKIHLALRPARTGKYPPSDSYGARLNGN
jgi:hypothetical protein